MGLVSSVKEGIVICCSEPRLKKNTTVLQKAVEQSSYNTTSGLLLYSGPNSCLDEVFQI